LRVRDKDDDQEESDEGADLDKVSDLTTTLAKGIIVHDRVYWNLRYGASLCWEVTSSTWDRIKLIDARNQDGRFERPCAITSIEWSQMRLLGVIHASKNLALGVCKTTE
jgi:hypothetical protein